MVRQIPLGSVEIQNGLWAYLHTFKVGGVTRSYYKLYSAEGYCFYYVDQPENYDEEGKLKAPTERVYAQFSTCMYPLGEINEHYVSVPIEYGYEIV